MDAVEAILVDYEYCLGCSECETACMTAHGCGPEELGIRVIKFGPWKTKGNQWQYDFIPVPTDWCDLCAERVSEGRRPACVRHCQYGVISAGAVGTLSEALKTKSKMMIFTPQCMDRR